MCLSAYSYRSMLVGGLLAWKCLGVINVVARVARAHWLRREASANGGSLVSWLLVDCSGSDYLAHNLGSIGGSIWSNEALLLASAQLSGKLARHHRLANWRSARLAGFWRLWRLLAVDCCANARAARVARYKLDRRASLRARATCLRAAEPAAL